MNLTTVASYSFVHEAEMAKSALAAAGIESFVDDENTIRINWFYARAIGGIKLRVGAADLEEAMRVLGIASQPAEEGDAAPETEGAAGGEDETEDDRCPACGGSNRAASGKWMLVPSVAVIALGTLVASGVHAVTAIAAAAILAAMIALLMDPYRCDDCDARW